MASFRPIWSRTKRRAVSKSFEDEQYIWESAAGVCFTVQNDTEMVHGGVKHDTKITFYLKEDQSEFSEERRLKDLVKTLSEFIGFPFELSMEKSKEKGVTDSEEDEEEHEEEGKEGWESVAGVSSTVQKDTEMHTGRSSEGTMIICFLKEDQSELLAV